MDWRDFGSQNLKIYRVQNFAQKFVASIFWDQEDILLIDHLPNGHKINAKFYLFLLVQLEDVLKEKWRGEVTKVVLFLHENGPAPDPCNWPTWASNNLITHPVLPRTDGLTLFPCTDKLFESSLVLSDEEVIANAHKIYK